MKERGGTGEIDLGIRHQTDQRALQVGAQKRQRNRTDGGSSLTSQSIPAEVDDDEDEALMRLISWREIGLVCDARKIDAGGAEDGTIRQRDESVTPPGDSNGYGWRRVMTLIAGVRSKRPEAERWHHREVTRGH